jgi:hypothetical protein
MPPDEDVPDFDILFSLYLIIIVLVEFENVPIVQVAS